MGLNKYFSDNESIKINTNFNGKVLIITDEGNFQLKKDQNLFVIKNGVIQILCDQIETIYLPRLENNEYHFMINDGVLNDWSKVVIKAGDIYQIEKFLNKLDISYKHYQNKK